MTPHWYDLLDVERDATPEEIRAAWKSAIADLEPDDRRFRVFNEAGAVLLDPERRAAYDATLPEDAPEDLSDEPPEMPPGEPAEDLPEDRPEEQGPIAEEVTERDVPVADVPDEDPFVEQVPDDVAPEPAEGAEAASGGAGEARGGAPLWVVGILAVLALAAVVVTVFAWTRPEPVDEDAARAAARAAVVPVLSYDYRTLDEDAAAARSYLTPGFRKAYDDTVTLLQENAPRTQTVVAVEEPLADAVVRSSEDRVDVLLYVNQPTTNAQGSVTYRNQVTLRMKLVDGTWLVDDLKTDRAQQ